MIIPLTVPEVILLLILSVAILITGEGLGVSSFGNSTGSVSVGISACGSIFCSGTSFGVSSTCGISCSLICSPK